MKKINFFLILCAVLAVSSCSQNEILNEEESKEQVNVSFLAQPDVVVTAGTRAAVESLTDPTKFKFYAFKKTGDTYSFTQEISGEGAAYDNGIWSSTKSQLAVGTYRFLCLYNVGDMQSLSNLTGLKGEWATILNGVVFEHKNAATDVNEFFSGSSGDEDIKGTTSAGNGVVVELGNLKRVVARIDVKFVKVATDGKAEVMYSDGNCIFGSAGNLTSITQTATGVAKKFSLGVTMPADAIWSTDCVFPVKVLDPYLTMGMKDIKDGNGTFPALEGEKDMDNIPANEIIKGGAYFRGAYVLPFVTQDPVLKLSKVLIKLAGGASEETKVSREIVADNSLFVKTNFITLITVKLLGTNAPGAPGIDDEHLFNPKVKFTVNISTVYDGVSNSDVVVE